HDVLMPCHRNRPPFARLKLGACRQFIAFRDGGLAPMMRHAVLPALRADGMMGPQSDGHGSETCHRPAGPGGCMANLQLSLAITNNPRTRPIIDGRVKPEGIEFALTVLGPAEMF